MSTEPSDAKIDAVFEAVCRAQWLAQVMDACGENLDDLPRWELWRAISERLSEARDAVDEAEGLPQ